MHRAFQVCHKTLKPDGRLVIVFAHKQPDAWETLVSAIIRAGFIVDGSWPIQTERVSRTNALSTASLSSSIWLVCKKRPETARPGWDNRVLEEMREKITTRLCEFWDAGIHGPDFVWAATGPALEAYSKHPVVKKAHEPGQLLTVPEFLRHVRRIVVDWVVGRILTRGDGDTEMEEEEENEDVEGTGSTVRLKAWHQRTRASMGYGDDYTSRHVAASPHPRVVPLIDQVHRLMHLWKAGDVVKVDDYLDARGLRRNALFHQLLQALIELAPTGSEERSLLESISNHVAARGMVLTPTPGLPGFGEADASPRRQKEGRS